MNFVVFKNQQTCSTHPKTKFSEFVSKFLKTCDLRDTRHTASSVNQNFKIYCPLTYI